MANRKFINNKETELQFKHLKRKKLTAREKDCLYLASLGKTSKETAITLNIAPSTVEHYRKKIKEKLNCKTIAEAIYKGINHGYLPINGELELLTFTTGDKSND
jgi:DNA-binding CsgD family transcriptional regulator